MSLFWRPTEARTITDLPWSAGGVSLMSGTAESALRLIPLYAAVTGIADDVSIMPWLDNDWIRCCNPIKLKEYLSLGQEVVTTWFPEVEHYRDFVHVAKTGDEFLARIDDVVRGKKAPGDRSGLLGQATWDDRTRELIAYLDQLGAKCSSAAAR